MCNSFPQLLYILKVRIKHDLGIPVLEVSHTVEVVLKILTYQVQPQKVLRVVGLRTHQYKTCFIPKSYITHILNMNTMLIPTEMDKNEIIIQIKYIA